MSNGSVVTGSHAVASNRRGDSGGRSSFWAFDLPTDLAFVLLTPALILLAFTAARAWGRIDALIAIGLSLAMAHYLPGMLRAYGDRALFRRFRARLLVAPLVLFPVTLGFAYLNLHIVVLIAVLWGAWHWMMQIYGFARIYDARAAQGGRMPALLDWGVCLLWFGMCVFVLNNDWPAYVTRFYESGGPLLPAGFFTGVERIWLLLTVVVTAAYVFRTAASIRAGSFPNPLKLAFIVLTFVYLSYTVSVVERPLMALVMFEAWHDIQYLAIVWMFNLRRAAASDAGAFIRFLFRPRVFFVIGYVLLCLAFGSLAHASRLFENETAIRVASALVTATAMLHYYLDGFIWKIREQETGHALGIRGDSAGAVSASAPRMLPAWAGHAALWLLFLAPAALFLILESTGNPPGALRIRQSIVSLFPESANARYELGREYMDAGRNREARAEFEQALALRPELLPARIFLGSFLANEGDMAGARAHFEQAIKLDPRNAQVHNNLGIVLEELGELTDARLHLERAIAIDPEYPLAHNNLGILLARLGDLEAARRHHLEAVRLAPDFADAHYRLGRIQKEAGDWTAAIRSYEETLRLDPGRADAYADLGLVLMDQGRLADAQARFEQALRLQPGDAEVRKHLDLVTASLESGASTP